jgi:hypothetical protein
MRMKESYVEGVAAYNGPESCGVAREGGVEALTGETAGWVLIREMLNVRGADAVEKKRKATRRAPSWRGARWPRAV